MIKLDEINKINSALIEDDTKEIIDFLNKKFEEKNFDNDSLFLNCLINSSNLFGYGKYLKREQFTPTLPSAFNESFSGDYYNYGQMKVLNEFAKNKKVFLSAPTSFGKTYLVLQYIFSQNFKNILLIVPTNSLLEELYIKVLNEYRAKERGFHVSTQPFINENSKNFLILTPERFLCLCETKEIDFFDICIMDESYQIQEKGKNLNCIISRAPKFRKVMEIIGRDSKRCIFMSPYTYIKTESMKRFFEKYSIVPVDSKIEYVSRKVFDFDSEDFPDKNAIENIKLLKNRNNKKSKAAKLVIQKFNQKNIVYVSCLGDAYEFLSYIPNSFKVEDEKIDEKNFKRFRDFIKHLKTFYKIDEKREWAIIRALEHGIGIYVSPLPRYIKKEIIKLYDLNVIKTLVVTTAFTEGVNTNAENLIVTSDCTAKNKRLGDIDLLNMAGRAGRFLRCPVGKIICVDNNIFKSVNLAIETNNHELNFDLYSNPNKENRDNYDLDLIEENLSQSEKEEKDKTYNLQLSLGLTNADLKSALFMPKKWKLHLYDYLNKTEYGKIEKLFTASVNIMNHVDNTIVDSIEVIFKYLKDTFADEKNFFNTKQGEIKPFDNSGNFIWGRLYKNYSSKNAGTNIANNRIYIKSRLDDLLKKYQYDIKNGKAGLKAKLDDSEKWILNYFDSSLCEEFEKFFSESFKFQSNIMQYKIPLYITFFVSIFKLYLKKNNLHTNEVDSLNTLSIALYFEDGYYSKDYSDLFDFGLPKELIDKIIENNISLEDIKLSSYNKNIFDDYENSLLNDFVSIFN